MSSGTALHCTVMKISPSIQMTCSFTFWSHQQFRLQPSSFSFYAIFIWLSGSLLSNKFTIQSIYRSDEKEITQQRTKISTLYNTHWRSHCFSRSCSLVDYNDRKENDSLDMLCTMYTAFITQWCVLFFLRALSLSFSSSTSSSSSLRSLSVCFLFR